MSSDGARPAITVESLGKRYRIGHEGATYGRLTESLSQALLSPLRSLLGQQRTSYEWLWALRDVSFEVAPGRIVGVIGRNGAGKTTLLKVLSRITEPTKGKVVLRGRVGSLLEVGTGFHPELTGRENVFLSGAVLGMRGADIRQRFDEIVAFSGVDRFIDTPIKRYSSGMQVRLGFAVAAHLDTDILIIDEVLAVGDAEFQRRCLAKIGDVSASGRTVLFVTHNMAAVEALCDSAMLLEDGGVAKAGSVQEVLEAYQTSIATALQTSLAIRRDRKGTGAIRLTDVESEIRTGADSSLRLHFESAAPASNVEVSVAIYGSNREAVALLGNGLSGQPVNALPANGTLVCRLADANLLPGSYTIDLYCTVNGVVADWITDAARIDVAEGAFFKSGRLPPAGYGHVLIPQHWEVDRGSGL